MAGTMMEVILAICLPPPLMHSRNRAATATPTMMGVREGS